jgi:ribosomal-protein-serine acetyltransferase
MTAPGTPKAAWVPGDRPPEVVRVGGTELHRWRTADAAALYAAVTSSLDHLRPWMPWAARYEATAAADYTTTCEVAWANREHFDYRIATADAPAAVLGSASLMARLGPAALEIGYWVRADAVRQGLATRAAAALTVAGLALPGVTRVEIWHDVCNTASAAIPARLGFTRAGDCCRIPGSNPEGAATDETGLLAAWVLHRDDLPGSPAAALVG